VTSVPEDALAGALPPAGLEASPAAAYWTLLTLAGGHFAVDCCAGIWPVFKTLAHLDIVKAGLIATVGTMAGNGLQLAFGVLADRGLRRRLIVAGVAVAGAVAFVPWAASSYLLMAGLVMVAQIGSAAFHPAATGTAALLSRKRTGFMIAVFLAGGYGGYSLSQVLFSALYRVARPLTALIALLPLVIAGAIAAFLRGMPAQRRPRGPAATPLRPVLARIAPLFVVQTLASAANVSLIFLLPDLLLSRRAAGWIVEGGGHFALVAGGCLSLLPAGHAADRWGARRVLVVANAATFVLFASLLARTSASPLDLLIVAGVGAFNGMNSVVSISEGNRLLPGQASGVSALLMGMPWCVAALGPVVAGILADPARGGTPARALGWFLLLMPFTLGAGLLVRARATAASPTAAR
jgi:FSR family fosmidomycin resistance protein-like MFS transporter